MVLYRDLRRIFSGSNFRKGEAMKKNWRTRIDEARERGEFTFTDQILAAQWLDCGCGEQDKRIKRHEKGQPVDSELSTLGRRFNQEVCGHHFRNAERVLQQIESRAAVLIAEVEAQK